MYNHEDEGWGAWPVVPLVFRGVNLREYLQYSGPSLMDGLPSENNITDDPQDEWSEFSDISEAADALVNGLPHDQVTFIRAGGDTTVMNIPLSPVFLNWV